MRLKHTHTHTRTCMGAVIYIDGGAAHPGLQVVHRERDVLGVVLREGTVEPSEPGTWHQDRLIQ